MLSILIHDTIINPLTGWEMLNAEEKWCSSGKAYYQTSDNKAGYQKLIQPTLGLFGFDPGCSTHTPKSKETFAN